METFVGEVLVILQIAYAKSKIGEKMWVPNNGFFPPVLLILVTHNVLSNPNDCSTKWESI